MIIFPGIRVWDVVSELVCLCTVPSPSNPFALDTRYIKSLPLPDRFLVTGALLNFLEMYVVYGNRDELHYDKGRKCWSAAGGVCFFGVFFLWCCHRLLLGVILCFAVFVTASRWCRLASFQKGVKRVFAFSSNLGCGWIFKGLCGRFFFFFLINSPFFPVVEEVKPLRRLHVQSLLELQRRRESSGSARSPTGPNASGDEWLRFVGVWYTLSTWRWDTFADFLGGKKKKEKANRFQCVKSVFLFLFLLWCV